MSVFSFHRDMTLNQCFVKVGQDRIEKILNPSQFKALSEGFSVNLSCINQPEPEVTSADIFGISGRKLTNMDAEEIANQRRLPKKRLLKSFHLEEAAEREFNSPGKSSK